MQRPTDFEARFVRAALASFSAGRRAVGKQALRKALKAGDESRALELMSEGIEAMQAVLESKLPALYEALIEDVGTSSARFFNESLGLEEPKAAEIGIGFNSTDPNAVNWVQQHGAETIQNITETTRQEVRSLVEESFAQQYNVRQLAGELTGVLGDKTRAELIARTETMAASNMGQQLAWQQAQNSGKLPPDAVKAWITTPDDRLCPICEPLEGERVHVDDNFSTGTEGPPAHPNCRCTMGLVNGAPTPMTNPGVVAVDVSQFPPLLHEKVRLLEKKAERMLNRMGLKDVEVRVENIARDFKVGNKTFRVAGDFNPTTKLVRLDPTSLAAGGDSTTGLIAHEYTHAKVAQNSATVQDYITKNAEALAKSDGVTEYSRAYWQALGKKPNAKAVFNAVNETLAEYGALEAMGTMPIKVPAEWKALYRMIKGAV